MARYGEARPVRQERPATPATYRFSTIVEQNITDIAGVIDMGRRINVFAGPGCGKSTFTAFLYWRLKRDGYNAELMGEYVKAWAYERKERRPLDQIIVFSEQFKLEHEMLSNDGVVIITPCPLYLISAYSKFVGFDGHYQLTQLAYIVEQRFPSFNIFLQRNDCPYDETGRWESYEEACQLDTDLRCYLEDNNVEFIDCAYNQPDHAVDMIIGTIDDI